MGGDYIEQQAIHFKNSSYFDGKTRVYLESEDDKYFWNYVISEHTSREIEYVCYTKTKEGVDVRGCKQILKFLPFFDADFFACIDSDYRRLYIFLGESYMLCSWTTATYKPNLWTTG